MSHAHELTDVSGKVTDVFAHRFVVDTAQGKQLADLGKHNAETIALQAGDTIIGKGERKPSEIKLTELQVNGRMVALAKAPKPDGKPEPESDPALAIAAAKREGLKDVGAPSRKPKHYEISGTGADGQAVELHVGFDGEVRKRKAA